MDTQTLAIFAGMLILISWYVLITSYKGKLKVYATKLSALTDQNTLLHTELQQERQLLQASTGKATQQDKELALLRLQLQQLTERYTESLQKADSEQDRFEHLANQILEAKTQKFDKQHREGISQLLQPLKERIQHFEQRMHHQSKTTIEQHAALSNQISQLKDLNMQITQDAANLTRALKGDNKTQGNWGELILETVLEKSGLEKDREYFVQLSHTDDNGKLQRPDVVIVLPDGKRMVIDSKVSLTAYESMVNAEDKDRYDIAGKAHIRSLRAHIDGLSAKKYQDLYQMQSPDFVLMFVPIDTAFAAATSHDEGLYTYAFEKNIVIVTPATLLATLKTVDTMWTNDRQHRNALTIAAEAGKMYDKLALFTDDLLDIGRRIDQTKDAYHESLKKLTTGKGNLISRAQKVKALGAKANKNVSEKLVERLED